MPNETPAGLEHRCCNLDTLVTRCRSGLGSLGHARRHRSRDGSVRVGPLTGEEPHLLLGHEGTIWGVKVDPKGRWIASSSEDKTIRLWPMPEGRPFHALPYQELLERLRFLTNYRVIADTASPGGYRTTFAPLPGWNRQPPVW